MVARNASLPRTIRADGVDWPLLTYLNVYGYQQVDWFHTPRIEGQCRICTLDDAGQVQGPIFADQVVWHGIVAWRVVDANDAPEPCFLCGTDLDPWVLCEDCRDSAEYDS